MISFPNVTLPFGKYTHAAVNARTTKRTVPYLPATPQKNPAACGRVFFLYGSLLLRQEVVACLCPPNIFNNRRRGINLFTSSWTQPNILLPTEGRCVNRRIRLYTHVCRSRHAYRKNLFMDQSRNVRGIKPLEEKAEIKIPYKLKSTLFSKSSLV